MKISLFFFRVLLYAILLVGTYAIIAYDTAVGNFAEATYQEDTTFTEYAQETLLLLMILICAAGARYAQYRHIHILLAVVAAISLVREFNNYLEDLWKVGVLMILIPAVYYFYRNFRTLRKEFEQIGETYAFAIILIGGLILHVFSRFYGYKTIWMDTMGEDYTRAVIRVSEEGIELLAYGIVFIGIVELYRFTQVAVRDRVNSRSSRLVSATNKDRDFVLPDPSSDQENTPHPTESS